MTVPTREVLLQQLNSLSYGARMARVAALGKEARSTAALTQLMDELLSGDAYEAGLALQLARTIRDEAPLLRGLTHPSSQIRTLAASLAGPCIRDDASLERLLPELAPSVRRRVLKGVALARRGALALRLLPQILSRHGSAEATLLFPALDEASVRRLLPELGHELKSWHSLTWRYPDAVLGYLQSRFAAAPERERALLFFRYYEPLAELTCLRSAEVLALARDFAPLDVMPSPLLAGIRCLTRRHPDQIFELLTRPSMRGWLRNQGLPSGMLVEADAFSPEQQRTLARLLGEIPPNLAAFLEALPPSRRAELFTHAFEGIPARELPDALLAVLPHALRDAEAERRLSFREVREDRDRLLATQALRLIEHAREPLAKAAFAAKAEDRAQALAYLVRATGLSRRGMTETLTHLKRLRNEQDPVRMAALSALAEVPLSSFTDEHIPSLTELVGFVVEARDSSPTTRAALQRLAFRLMQGHAHEPQGPLFQFALETLKRLAGQSGSLSLPSLERDLPRGAEHRIVATLLPMIRAAAERDSHHLLLALAQALGRRAWNVDMLQALLEPATEASPEGLARTAITLWLAPPRTRELRVRKLLDRDETTVTIPRVFEHLHRRRQDWLDPFLQGRRLRGRFLTGNAGWVPPAQDGFHRWLPRQQQQLAGLLVRIAGDGQRSAWERMSALRTLPRMPVVTVDTFTPFLQSQDVPTVEAALGALAWLDRPETALPLLLENLDGDRARVAMYAVPRVARLVSGETLSSTLAELFQREKLKVTVQKEAVRLLGMFRSARSLALLRQQFDRPQLHRDVRIAVGHAARQLLDSEEAWALLDAMARSEDTYVAASLLDQRPLELRSEVRPRYAALVLQVARHPDLSVRRRAWLALSAWSPGSEEQVASAASERILDLTGGAEWSEATRALVESVQDGLAVERVVATASALVMLPTPEAQNATAERDQPARQRLKHLCATLVNFPRSVRLRLRARLHEVARVIATDASLWPESAGLRLSALEWKDAETVATALQALAQESQEEPLFAPALASEVATAVSHPSAEWEPETLLEISDRLEKEAPLVSIELVRAAGERLHWREDAAKRLRTLREHPRPAIRAVARAITTAQE
ncbi:hypothetical protein [Hyalangium minutum]|uniref:Uncharacterized protein n=1 Tax=Hyalangium minutum TaxID=394096 RepID=A0A085WIY4_9BACT|nr:hypothetical protein [Hyalangium minutum]KFE67647.1 hypothetical protein DB31_8130 [Hyalangium minutum]